MEAFGIGETNETGDHLFECAEEHKLITANTLVSEAKNRYWTWESPDGETRNQTDFTLSNQIRIVTNCKVITSADLGSDHRLEKNDIEDKQKISKAENYF